MLMSNDTETVRALIMGAGGFAAVAREVGARRRETVRWWAVHNRVPPRWIPAVSRVLGKPEAFFWRLHAGGDMQERHEIGAIHAAR